MDINSFIKSQDYQEFKSFMLAQFVEKPLKIKTEGKSNEVVAREVETSNKAAEKLLKGFKKFENQSKAPVVKAEPFR